MTGKRVVTFGRQPDTAPKGMWRPIHFPELAELDSPTNEGMISRQLSSDGANSRNLPRTIYFQKTQAPAHMGSGAVGAIHEITIDGETGKASGKGWLIDHPDGHEAGQFVEAQALFHNSVDMSEVKVRFEEEGDFWSDDFHVTLHFDEWSVGATTLVGTPAFPNSHSGMGDEITAAFLADTSPLIVTCKSVYRLDLATSDEEIAARATGLPAWAHFHQPEADVPHPLKPGAPDERGHMPVSGHLALWEDCLGGEELNCRRVPRPTDGYASFNKPGVLTDRGEVECGPIALYGGHVSLDKAADDPANAWCDVRVVAGVHGPWLSGIVRPGTPDDKLYAARASHISGHWKGGRLRMITSVNAPGYLVPGSGLTTNANGEIDELVASFPVCALPKEALSMEPLSPEVQQQIVDMARAQHVGAIAEGGGGGQFLKVGDGGAGALSYVNPTGVMYFPQITGATTTNVGHAWLSVEVPTPAVMEATTDEPDLSMEIARRQRMVALDDEDDE